MGETCIDILTRTDPFEILPPDVLAKVADAMQTHDYEPGHYIFKQGDASKDCLFIVAEGLVEIIVAGEDSRASVVGMRRRYDFFGETVVLSRQRYPGSARVREKTRCISLARQELETLIYRFPEFSGFFNTLLAERMRLIYEGLMRDLPRETMPAAGALLFQRRVGDIMSNPPVSCRRQDRLAQAAGLLARQDEGALLVMDASGRPAGFLTAGDVLRNGVLRKADALDTMPVGAAMDCRIVTIAPSATVARALARMSRRGVRRLVVMERDMPVGVVSRTDLVKLSSAGALMLAEKIQEQTSFDALARVGQEAGDMLPALLGEKAGVPEVLSIMSDLYERLTRQGAPVERGAVEAGGLGSPAGGILLDQHGQRRPPRAGFSHRSGQRLDLRYTVRRKGCGGSRLFRTSGGGGGERPGALRVRLMPRGGHGQQPCLATLAGRMDEGRGALGGLPRSGTYPDADDPA